MSSSEMVGDRDADSPGAIVRLNNRDNPEIRRILLFGDDIGLPQLINVIPTHLICGLVAAEIRPHQHPKLQQLAQLHHLPPLIQPRHSQPNYSEFVAQVRALDPDLMIANSYSMLVRSELLMIPRFGAVNVHGALLPQYRGSNPIQWAIINNENETGVTMHYMTSEFDAGDIIAQRCAPILFEDTWRDVQKRLMKVTTELLEDEIPRLLTQTNTRTNQDETKARHYRRRHPQDGQFEWQQSVIAIYNLVRALVKPHPGAFSHCGAEKITLDQYLTLAQVTELKYGDCGKQRLTTANIALVPPTAEEAPTAHNWFAALNDAPVVALEEVHAPSSKASSLKWLDDIQNRNDLMIFCIRLLASNQLIGICLLQHISYHHNDAEIRLSFDDVHQWRQPLLSEVIHLLLKFAFHDLSLQRLYTFMLSADSDLIATLRMIGFSQANDLHQAVYGDNGNTTVLRMEIILSPYATE